MLNSGGLETLRLSLASKRTIRTVPAVLLTFCGLPFSTPACATGPPIDLVVILDQPRGTPAGPPAARALPAEIRLRPGDRVALVELKRKPAVKSRLTYEAVGIPRESPVRFGAPWIRTELGAGARIHDAISAACGLLPKLPDSRVRIVLLVSEDRERGSETGADRVLADLERSQVKLFLLRDSLIAPQPGWQVPPHHPHRRISYPQTESVVPLVNKTGGETAGSAERTFEEMILAIQAKAGQQVSGRTPP